MVLLWWNQGKYGFINKKGKVVIPIKFDYAQQFYEGEAEVSLNDETFYINTKGERINE